MQDREAAEIEAHRQELIKLFKKNMRIIIVDQSSPHIDREGSIKGMPDHLGLYRVRFAKIKADANFVPLAMRPLDPELQAETWRLVSAQQRAT